MLTLKDLKLQGLTLSKADAQELHSPINHIAQRGGDSEVVYDGTGKVDKTDPLKDYYAEIITQNAALKQENSELKQQLAEALKANKENVGVDNVPTEIEPEQSQEKKVWEIYISDADGWVVVGDHNLDDKGNLIGKALDCFEKEYFKFRQIPASQVGTGDSTGVVKVLLDINDEIGIDHSSNKTDTAENTDTAPVKKATKVPVKRGPKAKK